MRNYVTLNAKRQLEPTDRGFAVVDELVGKRFSFLEYGYTKHLETGLDQVAAGDKTYQALLDEAWGVLQTELARLGSADYRGQPPAPDASWKPREQADAVSKPESAYGKAQFKHETVADARCRCGGAIEKSPRAWSCANCPAIVWNTVASKPLDEQTALALLAGERVKVDGLTSKAGKPFSAILYIDEDGKVKFGFS